jgi:hypothetical protein
MQDLHVMIFFIFLPVGTSIIYIKCLFHISMWYKNHHSPISCPVMIFNVHISFFLDFRRIILFPVLCVMPLARLLSFSDTTVLSIELWTLQTVTDHTARSDLIISSLNFRFLFLVFTCIFIGIAVLFATSGIVYSKRHACSEVYNLVTLTCVTLPWNLKLFF